MQTLGFIGSGRMGEALTRGILEKKKFKSDHIFVTDTSDERLLFMKTTYGVGILSLQNLLKQCDIIIFSIKPQKLVDIVKMVRKEFRRDVLYVSIMAGVSIKNLKKIHNDIKIARVMPNTPAQLGLGVSALSFSENCCSEERECVQSLFDSVGKTVCVDESQMDLVTALSGSGPAYVFRFAQALLKVACRQGLSSDQAKTLVYQTLKGSVSLMDSSSKTCSELISEVSSPGGTTLAGLEVLEKLNLDAVMNDTVIAAKNRSKELGDC